MRPDKALSDAVDARQEIDLKVGVTFTRLLTRELTQGAKVAFKLPTLSLISYGPCQSPTLFFCVQRAREIATFVSRPFWTLCATARESARGDGKGSKGSAPSCEMSWARGECFDERRCREALKHCQHCKSANVRRIDRTISSVPPPVGLNTVQLLRACSSGFGMSPHKAMVVAEQLYTSGYISYPRTETTKYPDGFDYASVLHDQTRSAVWGDAATLALALVESGGERRGGIGKRSVDMGDHPPITPTRAASRASFRSDGEW